MHDSSSILEYRFNKSLVCWAWLAVISLAIGGLFSSLPMVLRLVRNPEIFKISLVAHVNFSVLLWMLSSVAVIYSSVLSNNENWGIEKYLFYLALTGAFLILCGALFPSGHAIINNYVPIITNLPFISGLAIFGYSIFFLSFLVLTRPLSTLDLNQRWAIKSLAWLIIASFLAFFLAFKRMPVAHSLEDFYENIFWGGGHVMQFAFVHALGYVFLFLIEYRPPVLRYLFAANAILGSLALMIYLFTNDIYVIRHLFTLHMSYFSSLLIVSLLIVYNRRLNFEMTLVMLLFFYGGVLGVFVTQGSAKVPAHYHGSIISVTAGMMLFFYRIWPLLGYEEIKDRARLMQIVSYGVGQATHISGLFLMGDYGALRKASGDGGASLLAKLMFMVGGLAAIIGGMLFIILLLRSFFRKEKGIKEC